MSTSPADSRRVLVDTSAYFALTDADDANHAAAFAIVTRLADERWRLFTTNFILAETHALLLARLDRGIALKVLQEINQSSTTIVRATRADERRALAILKQYQDKDFSYSDAVSFAIMERLRIPYSFAFDRHFAQYGFTILISN